MMLSLFSIISFGSTCKKNVNCIENLYSFQMGIKAYPNKDSVNIGDTVWFEIKEPVNLKDYTSNNQINYSGAENFGSVLSFLQLAQLNTFTIKAVKSFDFIVSKGSETNVVDPSFEKQYIFVEENGYFLFKLGIIPKEKGVYVIVFSNAANVYTKSDKCTKASFIINFKETDQHYYLNPNFQGGPTPVGGDYYFKVTE